jgi:hypothetical protein
MYRNCSERKAHSDLPQYLVKAAVMKSLGSPLCNNRKQLKVGLPFVFVEYLKRQQSFGFAITFSLGFAVAVGSFFPRSIL